MRRPLNMEASFFYKGFLALALLSAIEAGGPGKVLYSKNGFEVGINGEKLILQAQNAQNGKSFDINLGSGLSKSLINEIPVPEISEEGAVFNFGKDLKLEIEHPFPECTRLTWITEVMPEVKDCLEYGAASWFGGPEQWEQLWPVEKLVKSNYPMVTNNYDNMAIAERYWVNSEGLYVYVEPFVPLFIDSNTEANPNQLCFTSKNEAPYYANETVTLRYSVCSFQNVREAQVHAVQNMFGYPTMIPDELMFRHPIWSTWARYKQNINQTSVLQFAQEILDNGFMNSQLEIDDDWETCYGEMQFNLNKFPDPKGMVDTLKQMGFRVTLWVHPFINRNCPTFDDYLNRGFFVKNEQGEVNTAWWNGNDAAIIDFTNPEARLSFGGRLATLRQEVGLDGYKFDSGECGSLPQRPVLTEVDHQAEYSKAYVDFIKNSLNDLGNAVEVRVNFDNQESPLFIRMIDKDTRWGLNNGLRSVVTTLLQMNIAGYPMVLADMIGGNGYGGEEVTPELFIRWLQASTFMPSLQFSFVPWQFNDPSVVEISKKFVDLHYNYSDIILEAALVATGGGIPINTPICFSEHFGETADATACAVDDEYMLGRDILVAPVMDPGAVSRDIYLPAGIWTDMNTGFIQEGPILLVNYPAPLDTLPWFEKERVVSSSNAIAPILVLLAAALCLALF